MSIKKIIKRIEEAQFSMLLHKEFGNHGRAEMKRSEIELLTEQLNEKLNK